MDIALYRLFLALTQPTLQSQRRVKLSDDVNTRKIQTRESSRTIKDLLESFHKELKHFTYSDIHTFLTRKLKKLKREEVITASSGGKHWCPAGVKQQENKTSIIYSRESHVKSKLDFFQDLWRAAELSAAIRGRKHDDDVYCSASMLKSWR